MGYDWLPIFVFFYLTLSDCGYKYTFDYLSIEVGRDGGSSPSQHDRVLFKDLDSRIYSRPRASPATVLSFNRRHLVSLLQN